MSSPTLNSAADADPIGKGFRNTEILTVRRGKLGRRKSYRAWRSYIAAKDAERPEQD